MHIKKIALIILSGILFTACKNEAKNKKDEHENPNVLLIIVDDMSVADLGCYGNDFHETPNIDNLAGKGMQFTNAYAASPVCSPTRASIMTGQSPATLNLTDWITGKPSWSSEKLLAPKFRHDLPAEEITIAEYFKESGYKTASFGKWHLGGEGSLPTDHGFDINIAGNHAGLPPSYFYPYTDGDFVLPDLNKNGEKGEFLSDRLTNEAINWMVKNKNEPFFMYLSYFSVHVWLETKLELKNKYINKSANETYSSYTNPVYAGMIESLDQNVGKLIDSLEHHNIIENTIIVFYSDNGGLHKDESENTPATDNGIFREGKGHLYEGGIREPLIFYWEGQIKPGQKTKALFSSYDFLPTLTSLCNITTKPCEGLNFANHIINNDTIEERALFWHYPHYSYQEGKPSGAIREGDYKLIEFFEDNSIELYNLSTDPGETENIAKQNPEVANELLKKLHDWQEKTDAQMPTKNPDYVPESK
ncbi:MAG TPA: sulfatase [Bacteroidales bacterium]|nr:sulfatase [Bacteroidales bacterium]